MTIESHRFVLRKLDEVTIEILTTSYSRTDIPHRRNKRKTITHIYGIEYRNEQKIVYTTTVRYRRRTKKKTNDILSKRTSYYLPNFDR